MPTENAHEVMASALTTLNKHLKTIETKFKNGDVEGAAGFVDEIDSASKEYRDASGDLTLKGIDDNSTKLYDELRAGDKDKVKSTLRKMRLAITKLSKKSGGTRRTVRKTRKSTRRRRV